MNKVALLPYADFLGIHVVETDSEGPLLTMPWSEGLLGAPERVHGGAIAGLLEIAAIAAIDATLDDPAQARERFKPISVTVDYMRPGLMTDTFARGKVVRIGTRIANVAVEAWQDDPARPIAAARLNIAIGAPSV